MAAVDSVGAQSSHPSPAATHTARYLKRVYFELKFLKKLPFQEEKP